jgi:rfaE bifunctional protein nucleotidyltransferase chain/domain
VGQLISPKSALRIRKRLARLGKRVVFTNGVFDLLHIGHVRYLRQARHLGDVLMVGLNSDASARLLKGNDRPWVPELERAEVLCALDGVDYVILYDDSTAIDLVTALKPDVYVKGGDYAQVGAEFACGTGQDSARPIPEAGAVGGYGGRVEIVAFTPGHSSTLLAGRIRGSAAAGDVK